ncbi:MAG: hypothetical protein EOO54_03800, partial [Haliea sp.]
VSVTGGAGTVELGAGGTDVSTGGAGVGAGGAAAAMPALMLSANTLAACCAASAFLAERAAASALALALTPSWNSGSAARNSVAPCGGAGTRTTPGLSANCSCSVGSASPASRNAASAAM